MLFQITVKHSNRTWSCIVGQFKPRSERSFVIRSRNPIVSPHFLKLAESMFAGLSVRYIFVTRPRLAAISFTATPIAFHRFMIG